MANFNSLFALKLIRRIVLILISVMLVLTGVYAWPAWVRRFSSPSPLNSSSALSITPAYQLTQQAFNQQITLTVNTPSDQTAIPNQNKKFSDFPFAPLDDGILILSINEGGYQHLFAFQQQGMPLTRLTNENSQDIHPAISPDGQWVAFSSNRSGYWEIYRLSLINGSVHQITVSKQYDGNPSWSPDGKWLVYESYQEHAEKSNLDLFIQPIDGSQAPIQLTNHLAADHSPDWSPGGRQIAFISTRSGQNDVWIADLDQVDERFVNISHSQNSQEQYPRWSHNGYQIAWSARTKDGMETLFNWNFQAPENPAIQVGTASLSAWGSDDEVLWGIVQTPNQHYLTAYSLATQSMTLPAIILTGQVSGLSWQTGQLPDVLPEAFIQTASASPTPVWAPSLESEQTLPKKRYPIVELRDIQAAQASLQDCVDEAFYALRQRVSQEIGWDFLESLEQTFIPLSSPVNPGVDQDWLYTGRAFCFNSAPVNAGWVAIMREDYGAETYWRVFLRTRFQDGSQGKPLQQLPWNLNARHSGDPMAYEQGGMLESNIPEGYWIDFTALAQAFGWERQAALPSWRIAYSSIRYNQFVIREGLDWLSAMHQIYPQQALDTPTPIPPPTFTPTITLTSTPTQTPTKTPYYTRTPRPTSTPWPTRTSTPTRTLTVTPSK